MRLPRPGWMEDVTAELLSASPLRVTLVISSLGSGGAERVMATLANYWARNQKAVTLITLAGSQSDFYRLDPRVSRIALDVFSESSGPLQALQNNWHRLRKLRNAVLESHPQVVLSFTDATNVLVLLALRRTRIPVVISERIDPRFHRIAAGWSLLRKVTYRWAAALVVQTNAVRDWAQKVVSADRIAVIPNPIADDDAIVGEIEGVPLPHPPFIAAMGRLDPQKGFDLLLSAFEKAVSTLPEWSLVIIGEGAERVRLQKKATELGIAERVHFLGRVKQAQQVLQKAEMFVLSSRYEGFPNALLEAMNCGRAVVSFDCPSGPGDLITNEQNGILVPAGNTTALAEALRRVMRDPALRHRLSGAAREVREHFALPIVAQQWETLLSRTASTR